MSSSRIFLVLSAISAMLAASCAPKRVYTLTPVPAWDVVEHLELEAPEDLSNRERDAFRDGWRAVRQGELQRAASSLEPLGRQFGRNPTIASALGFLELRSGNENGASRYFGDALEEEPRFGPAQGGFFLLAMKAGDDEAAYERLSRLKQSFPQHELVDRFETTLQVAVAEARVRQARALASSGAYEEAASAYLRVLELTPEAGALYLETAEAELAGDLPDRAAIHAQRAAELEPDNPEAFRVLGEASAAGGNLRAAVDAYRTAVALRPNERDLQERYDGLRARYDQENLPAEYFAVRDASRLTREQLAALVYVELREGLDELDAGTDVIATDIAGSWSNEFIRRVVGAGVLEVYSNHMFQPTGYVTRIDLANALARAMEVLSPDDFARARRAAAQSRTFPDLAPENVSHGSAALAVELDFLRPGDGGAFEPQRFVSGEEAAEAVRMLAGRVAP